MNQASAVDRFWPKVTRLTPEQCWLWNASLTRAGYGQLSVNSRPAYAHRFAYELMVGKIPAGLVIDHLCRNRRCVNPAHMEVVTRGENCRRGEGVFARNKRKTHCPQGHPLSGENAYKTKHGGRTCKTCHYARARDYKRRTRHPERLSA